MNKGFCIKETRRARPNDVDVTNMVKVYKYVLNCTNSYLNIPFPNYFDIRWLRTLFTKLELNIDNILRTEDIPKANKSYSENILLDLLE